MKINYNFVHITHPPPFRMKRKMKSTDKKTFSLYTHCKSIFAMQIMMKIFY